ncbi:MAG: hypothetical protein M1587_02255 [Thaumarchaeota archaeon]|nr:hypothetical protein [Nitrososphaerota archaeon]
MTRWTYFLLFLGIILVILPLPFLSYSLCNPGGSGCYTTMLFGDYWPLAFVPALATFMTFTYSLLHHRKTRTL